MSNNPDEFELTEEMKQVERDAKCMNKLIFGDIPDEERKRKLVAMAKNNAGDVISMKGILSEIEELREIAKRM